MRAFWKGLGEYFKLFKTLSPSELSPAPKMHFSQKNDPQTPANTKCAVPQRKRLYRKFSKFKYWCFNDLNY